MLDAASFGQTLEVRYEEHGLTLSIERCLASNAVLRSRSDEVRKLLKRVLGRLGSVTISGDEVRVVTLPDDASRRVDADRVIRDLIHHVEAIAKRPVTPRAVTDLLGISSAERLRWTKDGRLKKSGSHGLRHSQGARVPTYAADQVAHLAQRPEIISEWRQADRSANSVEGGHH
ncbi:MAG: hypothetical protein AB7P94_17865 [Steroidobacteraceae bacterium]